MLGSQIYTKYVEQWLNDVLTDAEDMSIPGVCKLPESTRPLCRYQVDRMFLNNMGVSSEHIDRMYRALFVHSLGFFQLLRNATLNVSKGKEVIQANLWRVFQVLLEVSCKTEYEMITQ